MASFGGTWTERKLEILKRYLDAYTTALKDQPFQLIYVDAFAGEGSWRPRSEYVSDPYKDRDVQELRDGSPRIALQIQDKPFDKLMFVEKDADRYEKLMDLRWEYSNRDIRIRRDDANTAIPRLCDTLASHDRAVVFLDPYATQVSWDTVDRLARTRKVDCWILFPLMAIARMMPRRGEPSDALATQLDRIFGGRDLWSSLYQPSQQLSLLESAREQERAFGSEQIADAYRNRLASVFYSVAPTRRTFRNSNNSPMFDLIFAASNPSGAPVAIRIANHILQNW